MLTTLSRSAARFGALGARATGTPPSLLALGRAPAAAHMKAGPSALAGVRCFGAGGHDWNVCIPGSRIKNPDPAGYNDVYPGQGTGWWTMVGLAIASFYWGNTYDLSRGVPIAIGIFGPNFPM